MNRTLLNALLYMISWFILVHSAAGGGAWEGMLAAAIVVGVHLFRVEHKLSEFMLIFFSEAVGFLIEPFFVFSDVVSYVSSKINHSLAKFGVSFMMAAIFGFAGSICSYYAGHRMGAAEFLYPKTGSLLVIGLVWFFFLPLLYKVNKAVINFRENHVH